jgi:N-methylhydantoinase A
VGAQLGLTVEKAAQGILRVANANMERAIRVVSVERGYDPRDFALLAFGGCGGLHACEIAEDLGIRSVIVPAQAGVLSAMGMLMADRVRDYAAGVLGRKDLEPAFRVLEKKARKDMKSARIERAYDVRYVGQSYELTVPEVEAFHAEHERIYGYADRSRAMEVVTVRVKAISAVEPLALGGSRWQLQDSGLRRIWTGRKWENIPSLRRLQGSSPKKKPTSAGPCRIADYGATTYVPPGWSYKLDDIGTLVLTAGGPSSPS